MKKYILLLLVMVTAFVAVAQRPAARWGAAVGEPDFAYPQTVITQADSVLRVSTDQNERFQAMMSRAVATLSVDPDSVNAVVAGIKSYADTAPEGWSSLAGLYEASVLARFYMTSMMSIGPVTSPSDNLPADMTEWSSEHFRRRVGELVDKAISSLGDTARAPLSDFSGAVTLPAASEPFYPLLRDAVYSLAATCLSEVDDDKAAATVQEKILSMTEEGTPEWAVWYLATGKPVLPMYRKYSDGLVGAVLLMNLCGDYTSAGLTKKQAAVLIRDYLDREPVNEVTDALNCCYERLIATNIFFDVPQFVVPGRSFTVTFYGKCARTVEFILYRLKPDRNRRPLCLIDGAEKVYTKTLTFDELDFDIRGSVNFTASDAGEYAVAAIVDGKENSGKSSAQLVRCTPVAPLLIGSGSGSAFVAVDARDESPMRDAELWIGNRKVGVTDRNGIIPYFRMSVGRLDDTDIYLVKGKDRYELPLWIPYSDKFDTDGVSARFFVDRPVYHQGDTVRWAVVAGRYDNPVGYATASRGIELSVAMFDANGEGVDTLSVTTDGYGRASGSFNIPTDRLTGRYSLRLVGTSYAQLRPLYAPTSFVVSDFKLPTFDVRDLKVEFAADSSVIVSGRAMTLSGMAVADGSVSVELTPRYVLWRHSYIFRPITDVEEISLEGVTDAEGRFSVTVPAGKCSDDFNYLVTATVTSPAAETASASTTFVVNREFGIDYFGPAYVDIDSKGLLGVCAVDPLGKRVTADASWTLLSDSVSVATGRCVLTPAGADIDLSCYPVGVYRLAVTPDGRRPLSCDTFSFTTYSSAHNSVPASVDIFVPGGDRTVSPATPGKFMVGVGRKSLVYVFTYNGDVLISSERRMMNPGFNEVAYPAVKAGCSAKVTLALYTTAGYKLETVRFTATDPSLLTMSIESWRDNMTPGDRETVTVTLRRSDGTPVEGAVVATMYNRALELVGPGLSPGFGIGRRLFPFFDYSSFDTSYSRSIRFDGTNRGRYFDYPRCREEYNIAPPYFRYADFVGGRRYYMARSLRAVPMGVTDMLTGVNDYEVQFCSADAVPVSAEEVAEVEEDGVMEKESLAGDAVNQEVQYRASEVFQALWLPSLTTGDDGSASITFTVPDANGSWRFLAAAWDAGLFAAGIDTTAVSSKPVMVQPNAPRFLRAGDRADVSVTVFNNSGADSNVTTAYEVLDPATGKVVGTESSSRFIAAGASEVFTVLLEAAPGISSVVMRVRASLGNYTDGVQTVIPVLESGLTVIDSETFYLTDSKPLFASVVPSGDNSTVTLMYCGNPMWDVVKTLPALYDYRPLTATAAASALYGALTARGLNRRFPEIRRAIDIWKNNPQDSALVSRLLLNENLKLAALRQTPWVWTAASESERMQRLSLTFDPAQIKSLVNSAVAVLENLQQPDGGFAWGSWSSESSFWTTSSVLRTLGRLNSAGFLSGNSRLDAVIDKALDYLDNNIGSNDIGYAMVAASYPSRRPTTVAAEQAIHLGAQYAIKNWKTAPVALKARYALYLYAVGYEPVAREIIGSIRQFAVRSPLAGISFPSVNFVDDYAVILEAFATIDPQAAELDGMRQWLVLRTQVTDDLGSWNPVALVSSILSIGSRWTTLRAGEAAVCVGDVPVTVGEVESITGTFSAVLRDAAGRSVTVRCPAGAGVSYGSITSVRTVTLDSVAARGSSEMSVAKRFLVERDGRYVEAVEFAPGDRVRVQLTVKSSRDLEYVSVIDERPAAFEPVDQLPGYVWASGLAFYRENADSQTRLFITKLPRGTWQIEYDMTVTAAGAFASGPAMVQSQYAPELNARSASRRITVAR